MFPMCLNYFTVYAHDCFFLVSQVPRLETVENIMKLSQMIIQGFWDRSTSPLIQLPHLDSHSLSEKRKRRVSSILTHSVFLSSND